MYDSPRVENRKHLARPQLVQTVQNPYPKPKAVGGTLIRKVIQSLRSSKVSLPLQKKVLIATSGGVDSMALAHLLGKYGRRVVAPQSMTLLHFDHQWRKESSCEEKEAVSNLAKSFGMNFLSVQLPSPSQKREAKNLENDARKKRNQVYLSLAGPDRKKEFRWVFTAHHQDDVIETLIWRFFRGEFLHQTKGILAKNDPLLRVFLQVSKEELYAYAKEENLTFFEDPTNQDEHQMRAQLRQKLIPQLGKIFPNFKKIILRYAQ